MLFIMNVPGKPHVQYVDVGIHHLHLVGHGHRLLAFLHIISVKLGYLLDIVVCPVRPLHHGKLCARVQRIEQKVRIDLCLQILEPRVLQMAFHQKFSLLQRALRLHALPDTLDISADADHHGIECARHHAHLVLRLHRQKLNLKIALRHLVRLPGKLLQRADQRAHKADNDADIAEHHEDDGDDRHDLKEAEPLL